ncbi:MAG: hypothetical protein OEO84_10855 [Betaproteobacteria bacterium]|nr:hypothetical protein [Betaproteobacteria bacterium]
MRDAKLCPSCGFLLRYEDPPDPSFSAVRFVAIETLLWIALALFLAFLWADADTGELYATLGIIAVAAWIYLRPWQRSSGAALLARRRYHCAKCRRDFAAQELKADEI